MGPLTGAPEELVVFCSRLFPRLVGSLRLYCGDDALAEDLAQETLVRVCVHWPKLAAMEFPDAWAHRVALNLANSAFRRKRLRLRHQGQDVPRTEAPADGAAVIRADLVRGLATLPRNQRAALILRYQAGFSATEVAALLGVSPGAVRMLTFRAKEALAVALEPTDPSSKQMGSPPESTEAGSHA